MLEVDVVVIGAGIAGMTVAHQLTERGVAVALVEARECFGGRIATTHHPEGNLPLEFGAEFVHGMPPEIFALNPAAFALYEIGGATWSFQDGKLRQGARRDKSLSEAFQQIVNWQGEDYSLTEFLDKHLFAPHYAEASRAIQDYVKGFDAADPADVSVRWLAQTQRAEEQIAGDRQFRLAAGYSHMIARLASHLQSTRAVVRLNTIVDEIQWSPGAVRVGAHDPAGAVLEPIAARAAVITLPLSVLTAAPPTLGAVRFVPALPEKQTISRDLAMGDALKVVLRFREPWWEGPTPHYPALPQLGFLFAPDAIFPTWWTNYPLFAPLLTGWLAGPRATALAQQPDAAIVAQAIDALAGIIHVPASQLAADVASWHLHNWHTDPFARGAYSYVRVGGVAAPGKLAEPVGGTLFFAGEATNTTGHTGTVHGAIATGHQAVDAILRSGQGIGLA